MVISFIRKTSWLMLLFCLCACGGGSTDGGSSGNPSASVSTASNGITPDAQNSSDPAASPSGTGGTLTSPTDSPCTNITRSPCSEDAVHPALTADVAPSEPLPKNNCYGQANVQCSGASTLQIDNHIALTASGVHTYGVSTSNVSATLDANKPVGLKLASGGTVEVRSSRNKNSTPSEVTLILSNIGLSWDDRAERPPIIETFSQTSKRVELSSNGLLRFKDLPPPNDVSFYNYGQLGAAATQSHYANNIYFPRPEGVDCSAIRGDVCRTSESPPLAMQSGDWKTGGKQPDKLVASHYHLDGAIKVGSYASPPTITPPDNTLTLGDPIALEGLMPGAQGSRHYQQWSYGWSNLGLWDTQDKVNMLSWGGSLDTQKRITGSVAFGTVSIPERVPKIGTAMYSGEVHGWLNYDYEGRTIPFFANATVTVNFANNTAEFTLTKTRTTEDENTVNYLPTIQTTLTIASPTLRNYLSGRIVFEGLQGGIAARFFGPITTGSTGNAPAEMAGSFNMQCAQLSSCPVLAGGFLLRRQ